MMSGIEAMWERVHSGKSVYLYRDEDGHAVLDGAEHLIRHSPSGIEWGYGGSGPADCARSILAHWVGLEKANRMYQSFKFQAISAVPKEGREISKQEVLDWVRKYETAKGD